MNPSVLFPGRGILYGLLNFLAFSKANRLQRKKFEFKQLVLCLRIDLVLHYAHGGGIG